jgi:hypothetical protein
MDEVEEGQRTADLVALEVPDQMPADRGTADGAVLLLELRDTVLAAVEQAGLGRGVDRVDGMALRDGDERDRPRPPRSLQRPPDPLLHTGEIPLQPCKIHIRLKLYGVRGEGVNSASRRAKEGVDVIIPS